MRVYVLCWARWPAHGTVCARCNTRGRQDRGTIKRKTSPVCTYNTSFCKTYCSLTTLGSLVQPTFANNGFKVSSSRCSLLIFSGTCQPLTSRPSVEGLGTGVPMYFMRRRWRRVFLGPLVPPCSRLLSKSGKGWTPALAWALVTAGKDCSVP